MLGFAALTPTYDLAATIFCITVPVLPALPRRYRYRADQPLAQCLRRTLDASAYILPASLYQAL